MKIRQTVALLAALALALFAVACGDSDSDSTSSTASVDTDATALDLPTAPPDPDAGKPYPDDVQKDFLDNCKATSGGESQVCGCVLDALEEHVSIEVYEKYSTASEVPPGTLSQDAIDAMTPAPLSRRPDTRWVSTAREARFKMFGYAFLDWGIVRCSGGHPYSGERKHTHGEYQEACASRTRSGCRSDGSCQQRVRRH